MYYVNINLEQIDALYKCMYVCMYIYKYIYMYVCICIYIQIHAYITCVVYLFVTRQMASRFASSLVKLLAGYRIRTWRMYPQ